jgi:methionine sulfoxide reductase catalytic subunit
MVEPTSDAKYVRFETVYRPEEMKGQGSPFYPWPYQEGLRIDEAMNDLAILSTGIYGETILPRTARRSVWSCRGSMDSNPSNPSSRSS